MVSQARSARLPSAYSLHDADVRQMAVLFGVVGTVADDEDIADREADEIDRDLHLPPLRLVEQSTCPEVPDPALAQLRGGVGDRPAGIDNVVDEQYRAPGEAGRDLTEKPDRAAALFRGAVAAQPYELDLGAGARMTERAGEVGDKHPGALEQANDDKIRREPAGDLRRERLDPGGDLRRAEQNAYPAQGYFVVIY